MSFEAFNDIAYSLRCVAETLKYNEWQTQVINKHLEKLNADSSNSRRLARDYASSIISLFGDNGDVSNSSESLKNQLLLFKLKDEHHYKNIFKNPDTDPNLFSYAADVLIIDDQHILDDDHKFVRENKLPYIQSNSFDFLLDDESSRIKSCNVAFVIKKINQFMSSNENDILEYNFDLETLNHSPYRQQILLKVAHYLYKYGQSIFEMALFLREVIENRYFKLCKSKLMHASGGNELAENFPYQDTILYCYLNAIINHHHELKDYTHFGQPLAFEVLSIIYNRTMRHSKYTVGINA